VTGVRRPPSRSCMTERSRPEQLSEGYQLAVRIFAVIILGFGLAMLVVTLARGGGPASVGFLFGLIFCALGAMRLYLSLKR
jgi:hypothetical protein